MIDLFQRKKTKADRKREVERRLRKEVGLSRSQATHAVKVIWQELEG
jgi:hypothetical protein